MRFVILCALLMPSLALAAQDAADPASAPLSGAPRAYGTRPTVQEGGAGGIVTPTIPGVPKVFLPDIGIAGDFFYGLNNLPRSEPRYSASQQQPRIRDGQAVFFSPIDPFVNAQFTIDLPENGVANIEEAWLNFIKLPGGLNARVGRFLPQFGLLNQLNTFQLATTDRPGAISNYIGSDGLIATGADVNFFVPNPWGLNLKVDLNAARGDLLGGSAQSRDLVYLGTLDYSRDFLRSGSLESGLSVAQGPSPFGQAETLTDPYLRIVYAPSARRIWTWSVEGMLANRQGLGSQDFKRSVYTFLDYGFALRYHVGFLVDVSNLPGPLPVSFPGAFTDAFAGAPVGGTVVRFAPDFTWFVSDNTRLRVQYTHATGVGSEKANETGAIQATFSLGNLKQLQ